MSAHDPHKPTLRPTLVSEPEPTATVGPDREVVPVNTGALHPANNPQPEQSFFEGFRPDERVFVFIDGSNTYSSARALGFSIDFGLLRKLFNDNVLLQRIYYFTALPPDDQMSNLRRQVDWMRHHGYTVVHKPYKEYTGADDKKLIKGNVDVELTVHALELCHYVDHMVLFTGDGDFRALVEALQNRGKRVTVVSTTQTRPPFASDDLRKQTDFFIELDELRPFIARPERTVSGYPSPTIDDHL